jgi:DNA-binding transcriptional ArsR family regulator
MVNSSARLDGVFSALSDPTRRSILESIAGGELTVNQIAAPLPISLPAVSRHLRVLEGAGLILRRKDGRTNHIRARPQGLDEAAGWIARHEKFWRGQLESLSQHLTESPPPEASR